MGAVWRVLAWAWALTAVGLAASLAGNIGHAGWRMPPGTLATFAVAPVAAAAALGTALGLVKVAAPDTAKPVNPAATAQPHQEAHTSGPVSPPTGGAQKAAQRRAPATAAQRGGDDPAAVAQARKAIINATSSGEVLTDRKLARATGVTRYRAAVLLAERANGHRPGEE